MLGISNDEEVTLCGIVNEEKEIICSMKVDDCDEKVVLLNHDYDFANIPNDLWKGDIGTSCHMADSLDVMVDLRDCSSKVTVGSGENLESIKIDTMRGKVVQKNGKEHRFLTLENVKYVPKLHCKLISLSRLLNNGNKLHRSKTMIKILDKKNQF